MFLPITLIVILAISSVFAILANKFHFSEVIGLLAAGLVLSFPFFRDNVMAGHNVILSDLANLGLFTLMFVSGFEVSGNMLSREKKDAFVLTVFTMATSLILGFLIFKLLHFSTEIALIMGICFGITAEATKARILLQLKKMKTRIGALLIGTGIINDVFGVLALILVSYIFAGNLSFREIWVLGGVLLSFAVGIMVHFLFDRLSREIKILEKILLYALVPFFFIKLGEQLNFGEFGLNPKIFLIVFFVSFGGQMIGSFISRFFIKLSNKQAFLVGLGMNSKGAVELAIAFVALQLGILTAGLYSALIFTALVSTALFQIFVFILVKRYPRIMD